MRSPRVRIYLGEGEGPGGELQRGREREEKEGRREIRVVVQGYLDYSLSLTRQEMKT